MWLCRTVSWLRWVVQRAGFDRRCGYGGSGCRRMRTLYGQLPVAYVDNTTTTIRLGWGRLAAWPWRARPRDPNVAKITPDLQTGSDTEPVRRIHILPIEGGVPVRGKRRRARASAPGPAEKPPIPARRAPLGVVADSQTGLKLK